MSPDKNAQGCSHGTEELKPFFEDHIDPSAKIRTDKWHSYNSIAKDYPYLRQEKSDGGKNFKHIHRQIMMFKSWLRGIHHRCNHIQAYSNEFCYRFNRLKRPNRMFHNLIERMIIHQPFTHRQVICVGVSKILILKTLASGKT